MISEFKFFKQTTLRYVSFMILVFLGQVFGACAADPSGKSTLQVIAKVGESVIMRDELLREYLWSGIARVESKSQKEQLFEALLQKRIWSKQIEQAAAKQKIFMSDEEVEAELQVIRKSYRSGMLTRVLYSEQMSEEMYRQRLHGFLLEMKFLEQQLKTKLKSSEAEQEAYFKKHFATQSSPERILVRQILLKNQEEAEHVLQELLLKKISFEDAAKKYSTSPEKEQGGLLPWFMKGTLPPVFEQCFLLKENEISAIVPSDFGYHIFKLEERKAESLLDKKDLKEQILLEIRRDKEKVLIEAMQNLFQKEYPVSIDELAKTQLLETIYGLKTSPNSLKPEHISTTKPILKAEPPSKDKK